MAYLLNTNVRYYLLISISTQCLPSRKLLVLKNARGPIYKSLSLSLLLVLEAQVLDNITEKIYCFANNSSVSILLRASH